MAAEHWLHRRPWRSTELAAAAAPEREAEPHCSPPPCPSASCAARTPRLHGRLQEGLCCSPPPSSALKANLCSCGALAASRLSASQMERHGGSPPFPARLLQAAPPHLEVSRWSCARRSGLTVTGWSSALQPMLGQSFSSPAPVPVAGLRGCPRVPPPRSSSTCGVTGCSLQPGAWLSPSARVPSLSWRRWGAGRGGEGAAVSLFASSRAANGQERCLLPAPDASHSPALSSWFRLLGGQDGGCHAEWVSSESCSFPSTALPLPGAGEHSLACPALRVPGCARSGPGASSHTLSAVS